MGFWYNKKDDAKIASLSSTDWSEINSKIEFSELGFTSDDGFYLLVANAIRFTDVQKMGEKDFKIDNEIIQFKIARKDYDKKDFKTKQTVNIKQSRIEKWLCYELEKLDATKRYCGFIHLQDGNWADNVTTGKDSEGKELSEDIRDMFAKEYRKFEVVETAKIEDSLLTMPAGYSSGGYSKAETQAEKIKANYAFIEQEARKMWKFPEDASCISHLVSLLEKADDEAAYFLQVIEKILN
ncbi:MAG: hypothetical protein HC836_40305 [Richelia sp. RM2_1_2]|nr:hypothetical protein [Richelia sp. RM1_1_1]NJO64196.1 hypothetical protein [Richelia sp. RM2_1_2]